MSQRHWRQANWLPWKWTVWYKRPLFQKIVIQPHLNASHVELKFSLSLIFCQSQIQKIYICWDGSLLSNVGFELRFHTEKQTLFVYAFEEKIKIAPKIYFLILCQFWGSHVEFQMYREFQIGVCFSLWSRQNRSRQNITH